MGLYQRLKAVAWIFVLSISGTVIRFVTAEENLLVIKVNGTSERREKCDGLSESFKSSSFEISASLLNAPCTCILSSAHRTSVSNLSKTVDNKSSEGIAFQVSLPCTQQTDCNSKEKMEFLLIPDDKDSTSVFLIADDANSCKLPMHVTHRGNLDMQCYLSVINTTTYLDIRSKETHHNVSITVWKKRDSSADNETDEELGAHVNSPLLHSRPAHNNVVVIAVICVLVGVIILAGSLILVSLVMHRKRLSRRLAIHLRKMEEQGHPESVPLTDTPDKQTDQHVKLVGLRRLHSSGSGFTESFKENGFQPVSPSDVGSVIPAECEDSVEASYLNEELNRSYGNSSITNELFKSCDRTSVDINSPEPSAVKEYDSDSGHSDSFHDSVVDNLEQSLTGTDSGSNKEDKSVQTLNTDTYYQFFPSLMKIKFPKFRWRSKSVDSEHA